MNFTLEEICNINNLYQFKKIFKNKSVDEYYSLIKDKKVVIFGASLHGKFMLNKLKEKGINPKYFCDNDRQKWGKYINGCCVLPPDYLRSDKINTIVLICTMSVSNSIVEQLEDIGVNYLFADFNGSLGELPSPDLYNNIDKLIEVNDLFIDNFSQKVFLNVIKSRIFQHYYFNISGSIFLHEIVTGSQYFDRNYFKYSDKEIFVDCGAYDSDSIMEFILNMYALGLNNWEVFAFEPDKNNYNNIEKKLQNFKLNNVKVFNYAISNIDDKIDMEEIQNCNREKELYKVDLCKLDTILKNKDVTFIKMDIEGYELQALKGAEELIRKNKPKLAISVYHKNSDLFEIPIYIKSLVPEYKLFLRHHSYNTIFETICYAYI